jgi:hypothetical protein
MNNAALQSQIATNRRLVQQDEIAQQDRAEAMAAKDYKAAYERKDTNALAELDAHYKDKLAPGGIERAKSAAQGLIGQGQEAKNMLVRSSPTGAVAHEKIGQLDAQAQGGLRLASEAAEFMRATPGSQQEDIATHKLATTLRAMDRGKEADYIESGVAGVSIGTDGIKRRQTRVGETLSAVKAELEQQARELQGQYGTMPGTEIQDALQRVNAAIQQISTLEQGVKKNGVRLVGGSQGPAANNAQFLKLQQQQQQGGGGMQPVSAMPGMQPGQMLQLPGMGQQPQQPAPSMRNGAINRQQPAAGVPTK